MSATESSHSPPPVPPVPPSDPTPISQLTDSLDHVSIAASSPDNHPAPDEKNTIPLQPMIVYSRSQLLSLHNSPLVKPPPNMPELKVWFGVENEQNLSKKDSEPVTPNSARDRRFRRDVEDDASSRLSFRSTVSQPSQMGNFKHQSLRSTDRDRDRDVDKDRERDIRDREGQERLRHLSDKYDRDRLALPSSNLRTKDRDTAPHLINPSSRTGQNQVSGSVVRRAEGRETSKKKAGEASDDWRRGVDVARPPRDERTDNARREERERARSRVRDSSKVRRDPSTSRRERDRDDRDKLPKDKDEHRKDRDLDRDIEQDDSRRWRDDGKRDERIAARRTIDRDKERVKDRADAWDVAGDRRWSPAEDRDGRYRRTARDRKPGTQDELKDDRKERDKEKEPAWMETYVPNGSGSGILGARDASGGLDGIQAWKKELKEKEQKEKEKASLKAEQDVPGSTSNAAQDLQSGARPMDEIQIFKMLMKREEDKKKSDTGGVDISTAKSSATTDPSTEMPKPNAKSITSIHPENIISGVETDGRMSRNAANIKDVSSITSGPQTLLSILGSGAKPLLSSAVVTSTPSQHADDVKTSASRLFSNSMPHDKAIQMAGPPGLDVNVNHFNPPMGSRLLALGRSGMRSPGIVNSSTSPVSGDVLPNTIVKGDVGRAAPFSPFEDQTRSHSGRDEHNLPELHRRSSATHFTPAPGIEPLPENGSSYLTGKSSRLAKFFDGKQRDPGYSGSKAQVPINLVSTANPPLVQEQRNFASAVGGGELRGVDDLFTMLNNSTQGHRTNLGHVPVGANVPFTNSLQTGTPIIQQPPHSQQQLHSINRMDSLYDNRMDDRNFVPDGMVPGLRPAPPRGRENSGVFPDEDSPHFGGHRLPHNHQQRPMDVLYPGPSPPIFSQQPHRGAGLPIQQGHFRGGPSPISNTHNALPGVAQQRLPPGLANLGGRPPHDPNQFIGVPGLSGGAGMLQNNLSGAGGTPIQSFNNFDGPQNVNFGVRGPMSMHQLQNTPGHHAMGHHGNMDLRVIPHSQLPGIPSRGLNTGFMGHQNIGAQQPSIGIRQQPHLPSHVMPHMMAPHLQQQQQVPPVPLNQPAHDLMALLLGGSQRE